MTDTQIVPNIRPAVKLGRCNGCGQIVNVQATHRGHGRHVGQHPEHTYFDDCHCSVTWFGWSGLADGEQLPLGVSS